MPWKEQRAMSRKIEFVERAVRGEPIAALCREFGISRTTGHKLVKRFKERGYDGLEDESRRPKSTPLATGEDIVLAVLEARRAHPSWGPEKLAIVLRRRFEDAAPSRCTVARILKRAQLVQARRKRRPLSVVDRAPKVQANAPNEVWTVDFKGWWRAANGQRCEPLTVRDAFSRYVFALTLCSTKASDVRAVFEQLFRKYGVPTAIQCDNGVPFVSVRSPAGLSSISAWWVSLGIRIVRSRPACPQDNGGHERMHRDVRQDVQVAPADSRELQQRELDKWRQQFNQVRPHQALGGKTPAEVYKEVPHCAAPIVPAVCLDHMRLVRIYRDGSFKLSREKYFLCLGLAGFDVGLELIDALHVRAWFYGIDLGVLEIEPQVSDTVYADANSRVSGNHSLKRPA
jgi:putative transposase